jgi:hypothetical protein
MNSLATRHFQKFGLVSMGKMDLKKIENLEFLKNNFKFRNSCEKTFSNNLVFEPVELSPHRE